MVVEPLGNPGKLYLLVREVKDLQTLTLLVLVAYGISLQPERDLFSLLCSQCNKGMRIRHIKDSLITVWLPNLIN